MGKTETKWLVEYKAARPFPIYATDGVFACCDPSNALKFQTRDAAKDWMLSHGHGSPWHAVEYVFVVPDDVRKLLREFADEEADMHAQLAQKTWPTAAVGNAGIVERASPELLLPEDYHHEL